MLCVTLEVQGCLIEHQNCMYKQPCFFIAAFKFKKVQNEKKMSVLTLDQLIIELRFDGPHSHMLPIRGLIRVVEWSTAVQHVLPTGPVPQTKAARLPHEGTHICCSLHLHTHTNKYLQRNGSSWSCDYALPWLNPYLNGLFLETMSLYYCNLWGFLKLFVLS